MNRPHKSWGSPTSKRRPSRLAVPWQITRCSHVCPHTAVPQQPLAPRVRMLWPSAFEHCQPPKAIAPGRCQFTEVPAVISRFVRSWGSHLDYAAMFIVLLRSPHRLPYRLHVWAGLYDCQHTPLHWAAHVLAEGFHCVLVSPSVQTLGYCSFLLRGRPADLGRAAAPHLHKVADVVWAQAHLATEECESKRKPGAMA